MQSSFSSGGNSPLTSLITLTTLLLNLGVPQNGGFPITASWDNFLAKDLHMSSDTPLERGTNDAKSVTQPSARSQYGSTDDATVENSEKSHKHHRAEALHRGWDDRMSRRRCRQPTTSGRRKTLESFNRLYTQDQQGTPETLTRVA